MLQISCGRALFLFFSQIHSSSKLVCAFKKRLSRKTAEVGVLVCKMMCFTSQHVKSNIMTHWLKIRWHDPVRISDRHQSQKFIQFQRKTYFIKSKSIIVNYFDKLENRMATFGDYNSFHIATRRVSNKLCETSIVPSYTVCIGNLCSERKWRFPHGVCLSHSALGGWPGDNAVGNISD